MVGSKGARRAQSFDGDVLVFGEDADCFLRYFTGALSSGFKRLVILAVLYQGACSASHWLALTGL
ncbi:MAG: hypothetical protein IPJ49_30815 [Candidatus Obscuribacter sp.]|nr:hypothetical protein [Candidatus Obscuribacter sp.]